MPGFDGTGPNGSGPRSGRICGLGRRQGAGRRMGNGNGFFGRNRQQFAQEFQQEMYAGPVETQNTSVQVNENSSEDQQNQLEQRISLLETELVELKKQLGEE
jgi:uncharacterized protein YceH (UPF0502 family)